MPDYTVVKLQHFKSGLHLARGLTNAYDRTHDTLHSDKLKSAIFVSALQLFGKGEINESFFHAFTISSAFPFYYSPSANKTFYFFPKPETPIPFVAEAEGLGKKLKRIRYIEKGLFERLLTGTPGFIFRMPTFKVFLWQKSNPIFRRFWQGKNARRSSQPSRIST